MGKMDDEGQGLGGLGSDSPGYGGGDFDNSSSDNFGRDWDGSLDDDYGDVYGGTARNTYGPDGGDYTGGLSLMDNYGAIGIDSMLGAESFDPAPVDPYTGTPQFDVWDESNMNLITEPGAATPNQKISGGSKLLQILGLLFGNPQLFLAGAAGSQFGKFGRVVEGIAGPSNYLTPSMVVGTQQYADRRAAEGPIGGGGSGGGSGGSTGFGAFGTSRPTTPSTGTTGSNPVASFLSAMMPRQTQGFGNLGALPSGANLRNRSGRSNLYRAGQRYQPSMR